MSLIIGRGRYRGETYPEGSATAAAAAVAALRNRNIADPVAGTVTPFSITTTPSFIAAIVFTPKVSGVIQVASMFDIISTSPENSVATVVLVQSGTNLSITGGELTSNGWTEGGATPPVVNGTGVTTVQEIGEGISSVSASSPVSIQTFGISQPLPIGVPVVVAVLIEAASGSVNTSGMAFSQLSVLELP